MNENYYSILGISQSASTIQVKKAYRKLALKYHPDKNSSQNANKEFIRITKAYEILRDPKKRDRYDQILNETAGSQSNTNQYTKEREKWEYEAEQKAKKYSNMDLDDFLSEAIDSIAFHTPHIASIGCITYIFIGSGLAALFAIFLILSGEIGTDDPIKGVLFLLGLSAVLIWYGSKEIKNRGTSYKSAVKDRNDKSNI